MTIERDPDLRFHGQGTLVAVTRWISNHDEGLAEWLKNTRRAYQPDRADVAETHRVCAILLKDQGDGRPARIALLDVGGASQADLERWSVWQDPRASMGQEGEFEEQTQGNGGKAYMYRMFAGPARIIGLGRGTKNIKGFEGPHGSEERGTPGYMPNRSEGENAPAGPWEAELNRLLLPYNLTVEALPHALVSALAARQSFTLVEGEDPRDARDVFGGRIDAGSLLRRVARHDQSTLVLEQVTVYALHNGELDLEGEPLQLEEIPPHPDFELPRIFQIPEVLRDESGREVSTTIGSERPAGRLVLRTSRDNMPTHYRTLKPRWKVSYRTEHQMIGSKPVSELVPTAAPGCQYVYATLELSALEPDYVTHGRERPSDGPLVEAVDKFVEEQIRALAREIHDRRRHEFDQQELDELARENRMLDRWKDQFLPDEMTGGSEEGVTGPGPHRRPGRGGNQGLEPFVIEVRMPEVQYLVGKGARFDLESVLKPVVRDEFGHPITGIDLVFETDSAGILEILEDGTAIATEKGSCFVFAKIPSSGLSSDFVPFEVWVVDHVLLSPRQLEIPIGKRKRVIAEVTNDDGARATDVLLNWRHSAEDQLMVRVSPTGFVSANRLGRTEVTAGVGEPENGVWSRIPAVVEVVTALEQDETGEGKPRLLLTGRDKDLDTGEIRPGDPDEPVLWQLPSDVRHNVWWLNLEAPEARFAFGQREDHAQMWRMFHASVLVEMVVQVHMHAQYTLKAENEVEGFWAVHKQAMDAAEIQVSQGMWTTLNAYVEAGGDL
jgi:hypothetical protein